MQKQRVSRIILTNKCLWPQNQLQNAYLIAVEHGALQFVFVFVNYRFTYKQAKKAEICVARKAQNNQGALRATQTWACLACLSSIRVS